jgi:tetratricopeptide (TPR) repeat protein
MNHGTTMRRALAALAMVFALALPAPGAWLASQVPDGPAAETTRAALEALENGEAETGEDAKLVHYRRGLELAKRAVAIDDESADAHFAYFANWGRILQQEGWFRNAFHLPTLLGHLDRALELDPNHADALASRAGLYLQLPKFLGGDPKKGEPMLRRAIEMDPEMAGGRLELAKHCMDTERPEEASKWALQALQIARGTGKQWHEDRALTLLDELGVHPPPIQASSATGVRAIP